MNKTLLEYLMNTSGTLSFEQILLNFVVALALGFFIFLSYRLSHSSPVYSPRFNASLLMLTIITTMVMCVIGNNIALSLGMVGALSVVRFRTAIKDPRDTSYIFWCIGVGLCCGVSEYHVPCVGSAVLFLILIFFGAVKNNDRYLLIVHADEVAARAAEKEIHNIYAGKAFLRVRNASRGNVELIYELSRKVMKLLPDRQSINDRLMDLGDVRQVNLVMQSEEVSR
ncbi:MAG: DUF4956 domain-containing protein [Planctomycetes bacterium]|nr:DUF4956 domain-containing protein [Planctomycetota bacterium]